MQIRTYACVVIQIRSRVIGFFDGAELFLEVNIIQVYECVYMLFTLKEELTIYI